MTRPAMTARARKKGRVAQALAAAVLIACMVLAIVWLLFGLPDYDGAVPLTILAVAVVAAFIERKARHR